MDIPFHSEKGLEVNKLIFETIYYGAMYQSNVLAMERQEKMKKLREMLDNDANSYLHIIKSLKHHEFYSDKVMFEDSKIFDLYQKFVLFMLSYLVGKEYLVIWIW